MSERIKFGAAWRIHTKGRKVDEEVQRVLWARGTVEENMQGIEKRARVKKKNKELQ